MQPPQILGRVTTPAFIEQALPEGKYVVRTYAGREGDVDAAHPTLQEAIAAFQAAPVNSDPRVIYEGRTLAALDRKLVPVFSDDEAQRIHRELFGGFVLRTYRGFDKGNVNTAHPTLEAALEAFAAAPSNVFPRVLQDGRIVAELDLEAGLAPIFGDDETQRIYRRMFDQGGLDREHVQS